MDRADLWPAGKNACARQKAGLRSRLHWHLAAGCPLCRPPGPLLCLSAFQINCTCRESGSRGWALPTEKAVDSASLENCTGQGSSTPSETKEEKHFLNIVLSPKADKDYARKDYKFIAIWTKVKKFLHKILANWIQQFIK